MATRLYFHVTANALGNLPTTEQSTLTSDKNADPQTTNRLMNTTIGTGFQPISITALAQTSQQTNYFTRFVSQGLSGTTSISANTWTVVFGCLTTNSSGRFPTLTSPLKIVIYIWRPSTQTKVGNIFDGNSVENGSTATTGSPYRMYTLTCSGAALSGIQDGDVICYEAWFQYTQSVAGAYTNSLLIDGTLYSGGTTTDPTAYIETPQNFTFSTVVTVNQLNIHKYKIRVLTGQSTDIYKYKIRKLATSIDTHKYKIRKIIANARILRYKIRKVTGQLVRIQRYKIRQLATNIETKRYKIRKLTGQLTRIQKYKIRILTGQRTRIQLYKIRKLTGQLTRIQKYKIRVLATNIEIKRYKIRQLATNIDTHKYKIRLKTGQLVRIFKYKIRVIGGRTSIQKYKIRQIAKLVRIQKYNIKKLTGQSTDILKYKIRVKTGQLTRIYKYKIRILTGQRTRIILYKIRKIAGLTSIQRYKIRKIANSVKIIKYNIRTIVRTYPALYFDGVNDYLQLGTDATLWNASLDSFSLSFWIYPLLIGDVNHREMFSRGWGQAHGFDIYFLASNKRLEFEQITATWSTRIVSQYIDFTNLPMNRWYHITVVYNKNDATFRGRMYLNGVENFVSATNAAGETLVNASAMFFGTAAGLDYQGYLKDFRWFTNKVLTQTEITDIYNNSVSAPTPNYWLKFNQTSGSPIDSISGTKTATIVNGALWSGGLFQGYKIRVLTGQLTRIYKYKIRKLTGQLTRIQKYKIRQIAKLVRIAKYNIRTLVRNSDTGLYKIRIKTGVSVRIYKYRIAVKTGQLVRIQKYKIRKLTGQLTRTQLYKIRRLTGESTDIHKYKIRQLVTKANVLKYKIRQWSTRIIVLKYKIRKVVTLQRIYKYKIRKLTGQLTRIQKYKIRKVTGLKVSIAKYKIRKLATASRICKYNIIQFARHTITSIYNIVDLLSIPRRQIIAKYNIRKLVVAPSTSRVVQFDGVNDYLNCGNDSSLWSQPLSKFSMSMWVLSQAQGGTRYLIYHGASPTPQTFAIYQPSSTVNRFTFRIVDAAAGLHDARVDHTEDIINKWLLITAVYDSTAAAPQIKIYCNLKPQDLGSNCTETINHSQILTISQSTADFQGYVKDFRWFTNKALTAAEIAKIYTNDPTAPTPDYYLPMNEGSGNPVDSISGTKTATLTNGASWISLGQIFRYGIRKAIGSGGVLQFDPTGGTALPLVTIPNIAAINNLDSFTLSIWVYPYNYGASSTPHILTKGYPANNTFILYFTSTSGRISWRIQGSDGSLKNADSVNPLPLNTWTHIIARFDRPTGTLRLRLNGVQDSGTVQTAVTPDTIGTVANLTMNGANANANKWGGKVKDFRLFRTALSDADCNKVYRNDPTAPAPNYWLPLNDGDGEPKNVIQPSTATLSTTGIKWVYDGINSQYKLRQLATAIRTFPYNIRLLISKIEIRLYNIRQLATSQRIQKYKIRQLMTTVRIYKYKIRQLVKQPRTLRYKIRKLVPTITRIAKYKIRVKTGAKVSIAKYKIRVLTGIRTRTLLYKIRLLTGQRTRIIKYRIRVKTGLKVNVFKYKIRRLATKVQIHKYNVRQLVSTTQSYLYDIKLLILIAARTLQVQYHIAQLVHNEAGHYYDIRTLTGVRHLTAKYKIFLQAAASRIFVYRLHSSLPTAIWEAGVTPIQRRRKRPWWFKAVRKVVQPLQKIPIPKPARILEKLQIIQPEEIVVTVGRTLTCYYRIMYNYPTAYDRPRTAYTAVYPYIIQPDQIPLIQTSRTRPAAVQPIVQYKPYSKSRVASTLNRLLILTELDQQLDRLTQQASKAAAQPTNIDARLARIESQVRRKLIKFYNNKIGNSIEPVTILKQKYDAQVKAIIRSTIESSYVLAASQIGNTIKAKNPDFELFISQSDLNNIQAMTDKLAAQFWVTAESLRQRDITVAIDTEGEVIKKKPVDPTPALTAIGAAVVFNAYNSGITSKLRSTMQAAQFTSRAPPPPPPRPTGDEFGDTEDFDFEFEIKPLTGKVMFTTQRDERVDPDICQPLDGTVWDIDDPAVVVPPEDTHPNCRCHLVPVID